MSRGALGQFFRFALLASSGVGLLVQGAAAKEIAPYRVALSVGWGERAGSDAFRDDLSRSLSVALASRCFSYVVVVGKDSGAEGTDLVFDVILSGVVDETRYGDSIAGTLQPGEPTNELRRIVRFEVTVDAQLTVRAGGQLVNRKHFIAHVSHRPVYVGEDAQAAARAEAISDIVHTLTRALGCGGAKLGRKIKETLGNEGPASPEPR